MKNKFLIITLCGLMLTGCFNSKPVETPAPHEQLSEGLKCTTGQQIFPGIVYFNNQYEYMFYDFEDEDLADYTGWSVKLADPSSTEPATSEICSTIDGYPIISASNMYHNSNASVIDVSSFKSYLVYFMRDMFNGAKANQIIGLDKLYTKNVYDMGYMFANTNLDEYDVSNFDTSNVVDMDYMFSNTNAVEYNIENFVYNDKLHAYGMFYQISSDFSKIHTSVDKEKWNSLLGL